MKLSELRKRQTASQQERLVREGDMEPMCEPPGSNIWHAKHDFESPLSNYCKRCGLTAKDGVFTEVASTDTKAEAASYSHPHPSQEIPTSQTFTKRAAPAGHSSAPASASTGSWQQQSLNL